MAKVLASEEEIHEIEDRIYKRGRGRPREDAARRNAHTVRLDDAEEDMLRHIEIEEGDSKSDIIRKALKIYYNICQSKW